LGLFGLPFCPPSCVLMFHLRRFSFLLLVHSLSLSRALPPFQWFFPCNFLCTTTFPAPLNFSVSFQPRRNHCCSFGLYFCPLFLLVFDFFFSVLLFPLISFVPGPRVADAGFSLRSTWPLTPTEPVNLNPFPQAVFVDPLACLSASQIFLIPLDCKQPRRVVFLISFSSPAVLFNVSAVRLLLFFP